MKLNCIANLNEILQLFDSSYHTYALSSTSTKSPFKSCLLHYSHLQTIAHLSKFFGAPLAIEMWATIFNHKIIQAQPRIKELMMDDFDYESIYTSIIEGSYTEDEKKAIRCAVKFAYDNIDTILREYRPLAPVSVGLTNIRELL